MFEVYSRVETHVYGGILISLSREEVWKAATPTNALIVSDTMGVV